eukprot:TRINITY_DN4601_c0_g2_i10.p1 TRINITY_DN4601_c0_g2~~TRINITY_DN4601_c0_g2_i10.p1  ORF type:complete len:194 (-),score=-21.49 TRINITY_DN4601_c0_g2_i10:25-606(-)
MKPAKIQGTQPSIELLQHSVKQNSYQKHYQNEEHLFYLELFRKLFHFLHPNKRCQDQSFFTVLFWFFICAKIPKRIANIKNSIINSQEQFLKKTKQFLKNARVLKKTVNLEKFSFSFLKFKFFVDFFNCQFFVPNFFRNLQTTLYGIIENQYSHLLKKEFLRIFRVFKNSQRIQFFVRVIIICKITIKQKNIC